MLRIKLVRFGKKGQPSYRVVVNEQRIKLDGKYIEQVGFYNPISKELKFDTDLYAKWLAQGAKPSETVASLYNRFSSKK